MIIFRLLILVAFFSVFLSCAAFQPLSNTDEAWISRPNGMGVHEVFHCVETANGPVCTEAKINKK